LKAERFRDALLEVGFQLSSDVLATLILRFVDTLFCILFF